MLGCIVAIIGVLLLTCGHSLVEETYNIDSVTVNTSIQGGSEHDGVNSITGDTSTNRVGLVQVNLYALSGPRKYVAHHLVTLGMMSPNRGTREWTYGVSYSGKAWDVE